MAKVPDNYRKEVKKLTEQTIARSPTLVKAREDGKHIDHKVSIKEGATKHVPAKTIAARENLTPMTPAKNLEKGAKSSQTVTALKNKISIPSKKK